jgi:hypothetical protein
MEIVNRYRGAQPGKTTDFVQTDDGQGNRAGEQDQGLHQIGVNHRGQSARDGIDTRRHNQNDRGGQGAPAHHTLQNNRRGIEMHGDFRKDISNHGNRCKVSCAIAVEAAFQKLRHGENVRTKVERHENPAEQEQHQAGQPFKMAYGQARRGAGTCQTDEVFRGNVRNKQGRADGEPTDVAAGKEIVLRSTFLLGKIEADAEYDGKVDPNDHEVQGSEGPVGNRN